MNGIANAASAADEMVGPLPTPGNPDTATLHEQNKKTEHLRQSALNHPLVMDALELFNGKVLEVKIL